MSGRGQVGVRAANYTLNAERMSHISTSHSTCFAGHVCVAVLDGHMNRDMVMKAGGSVTESQPAAGTSQRPRAPTIALRSLSENGILARLLPEQRDMTGPGIYVGSTSVSSSWSFFLRVPAAASVPMLHRDRQRRPIAVAAFLPTFSHQAAFRRHTGNSVRYSWAHLPERWTQCRTSCWRGWYWDPRIGGYS